jgi:ATP-binding cassette, subfamily C, bacterial CydC
LALARALLRPAPWLMLDEPTEALVMGRLDRRLRRTGHGLLLVSHRPAILGLCSRALRLDAHRLPAAA